MNQQEVIDLMRSSKSKEEWNVNCDKVKEAHNGQYPDFWYESVILSGLADEVLGPGASKIRVTALEDVLEKEVESGLTEEEKKIGDVYDTPRSIEHGQSILNWINEKIVKGKGKNFFIPSILKKINELPVTTEEKLMISFTISGIINSRMTNPLEALFASLAHRKRGEA